MSNIKKNISIKKLNAAVFACGAITHAYAGQNIAKFFDGEQRGVANTYLSWLDKDKKPLASIDTQLLIQQNATNYYYLRAEAAGFVTSIAADMKIRDRQNSEVGDIQFSSPTQGRRCTFVREGTDWFCKVKFVASENSPVGVNAARNIFTYPSLQNQTADFNAISKNIYISPATEVGSIISTGPDEVANTLSAIAVSDNATLDNVPLTVKIKNADSFIKDIYLYYKFADKSIADADGKVQGVCLINKITAGEGSCTINVTPYQTGKTEMNFLPSSHWVDTNGDTHSFKKSEYSPVKINVGTLFAGYNAMSPQRRVYRKGSTLATIANEPVDGVIRGLAVDEPQHKLYVMSRHDLYRQTNATESQLGRLIKLVDVPYPDGNTPGAAQRLNLPDAKDTAIIGTGYAQLFQVKDKNKPEIIPLSAPSASITSSAIDPVDNVLYFADSQRGFSIYYTRYGQSQTPNFATFPKVISLFEMKVAAYNNKAYAAGSYGAGPFVGSKLFMWAGDANAGKMVEVDVDENTSPFKRESQSVGNKITSLFFTRQGDLYATGSKGGLYRLENREAGGRPYWKEIAKLTSIGGLDVSLSDNAIDANGNIYLSSDAGLWKVPFNNPAGIYRLQNYHSYISAIVVDNNR